MILHGLSRLPSPTPWRVVSHPTRDLGKRSGTTDGEVTYAKLSS